jgi:hypothetical protein
MPIHRDIPVLQYAKALPWHRQRRWRRVMLGTFVCILALVSWRWGKPVWRWGQVQYYQRLCLRYSRPADQIVALEGGDPDEIIAVAAKDPHYVIAGTGVPIFAAHTAVPFDRLMEILHPFSPSGGTLFTGVMPQIPVLFLHARKSNAGHDRLVALFIAHEYETRGKGDYLRIDSAVFECGIDGPRQLKSCPTPFGLESMRGMFRFFAGQPDPADPSKFTIDYIAEYRNEPAVHGSIVGRLDDKDCVELDTPNAPEKCWDNRSYSATAQERFSIDQPFERSEDGWSQMRVLSLNSDTSLSYIRGLTQLQFLFLSGSKVTDAGMESLKNLPALTKFYLQRTRVTDAGLVEVGGLKALQLLDLKDARVTDAGLSHLKGLTALQKLHLSGTKVTDAGLAQLNGLTTLQELDLSKSQVTDAGLAQLKGLTALQKLNLSGTNVTGAGLAQLNSLTALQELDLSYSPVTDAGLEGLKGLTALRRLLLDDTRVTDAGVADIRRAMPYCKIDH